MSFRSLVPVVAIACSIGLATNARGDSVWVGGSGTPINIWSDPTNWSPAGVPTNADLAVLDTNGTTTLIDSSVNAIASGLFVSAPLGGVNPIDQAASNTLLMTGGSLTVQGGALMNVGRGRNIFDGQLAQFVMTGGVLNASGIAVPEAFNPSDLPNPALSKGVNAEMHLSGNAVINTDLLNLGAWDSHSLVTLSDNAQINLTDDNNGFADGLLHIEYLEHYPAELRPAAGSSLMDLRDNSRVTIHGNLFTLFGLFTKEQYLDFIRSGYIDTGYIVANGGASAVRSWLSNGVIYISPVPEPATVGLGVIAAFACALFRCRRSL